MTNVLRLQFAIVFAPLVFRIDTDSLSQTSSPGRTGVLAPPVFKQVGEFFEGVTSLVRAHARGSKGNLVGRIREMKGKPLKTKSPNHEPVLQRLGQSAEFVRELERLAELAPAEHGDELRRIARSA